MNYILLAPAVEELRAAVAYYAAIDPDLGTRFRDELERVMQRIVAEPLLWHERKAGYRRVNCRVFPYYVAYFLRGDLVVIAAVAHAHRRPEYWFGRL